MRHFASMIRPGTRVWIFLVFFLLPYLFFGIGTDLTQVAIAPGDGTIQGVPSKVFTAEMHLWNPLVQTGVFPQIYMGWQALYPPGILIMRVFPPVLGYNILLLAHYTLAGFGAFLFLEKAGLRRVAAIFGGLAFMFCGFLTAHKGHHTMMMAAAYLPIIFYFFERYARSKRVLDLLLAGMMFGLCLLADYIAVPMYIGMLLLPYMICTILLEPGFVPVSPGAVGSRARNLLHRYLLLARASALVFGVGLLMAFVEVIPIVESLEFVTRQNITYDFFISYSFSPRLLPLLIFPFFYGAHVPFLSTTSYFGPGNLTELTGYMGILPLWFAAMVLLLFWKKNWRVVFWGAAAAAAFLLVLGGSTPFYRLMFHVPVYNMFRVPARNWLEVNFTVAVLAGYCVHYILELAPVERKRFTRTAAAVLVGFSAITLLILQYGYRLGITMAEDHRLWQNSRLSSTAVTIPLIIIACSAVYLLLLWRFRSKSSFWLVGAGLIVLDLFSFGYIHDFSYPSFDSFADRPNRVAQYLDTIDPAKELYRVLPLYPTFLVSSEQSLYPLTNTLYGFQTTNGYGAIWLQDFRDLTTFEAQGATPQKAQLLQNSVVLSMLSTKYIITSKPEDHALLEQQRLLDAPALNMEQSSGRLADGQFVLSTAQFRDGTFHLQSPAPDQVSLIEILLEIAAEQSYQVSFSARLLDDSGEAQPLVVDFFAPAYDFADQEAIFPPFELTSEFQTFSAIFPAGTNPPVQVSFRLFTFSPAAYEIKDIRLTRHDGGVISWGQEPAQPGAPLYVKRFESPAGIAVYENKNFLPRARFVQNVVPAESTAAAIRMLRYDSTFNPAQSAVVEGWSGSTTFAPGTVLESDYAQPEQVLLTVETGESSFLVLADSYYVGWKAFVDGQPVPIYKTNATTRGIRIDGAGQHSVRFQFVPWSFYIGLAISLLTLLAIIVYAVLSQRRKTVVGNAKLNP